MHLCYSRILFCRQTTTAYRALLVGRPLQWLSSWMGCRLQILYNLQTAKLNTKNQLAQDAF